MSEFYLRVVVGGAWIFSVMILFSVMSEMFCDFEDIVLGGVILFLMFSLLYIVLDNARENKRPLLHPKSIRVVGACIFLCAVFRTMEKADLIDDEHVGLFYIFTILAGFVLNITVFSVDNYIPMDTTDKRNIIENKKEIVFTGTMNSGWLDFDAFDSEKYSVDISYKAMYFDKSEKDADIHFKKQKSGYFAEIENHPMRDYNFAENQDFDDFLLDLSHKNSHLIKAIYMCTYFVPDWAGVKEICDKISSLSLKPEMHKSICFSIDDIDDFIAKIRVMNGLSEKVRGYFKYQFKQDLQELKPCGFVRKWGKETEVKNTLILKIKETPFAIIKKYSYSISFDVL